MTYFGAANTRLTEAALRRIDFDSTVRRHARVGPVSVSVHALLNRQQTPKHVARATGQHSGAIVRSTRSTMPAFDVKGTGQSTEQ